MKKFFPIILALCVFLPILCLFDFEFNARSKGCAFCSKEVLGSQTIFQGDSASAMLTHKPAVPGHVLIIPSRHVERFDQLTAQELVEMGDMIRKVNAASKKIYGNTGYLLLQKNGKEAGQSVPHVHFHYLPRKVGDSHLLFTLRFFASPWLKPLDDSQMRSEVLKYRIPQDPFNL